MKVRSIYTVPSRSIHSGTATQWRLFQEDEFLSTLNGVVANIINPGMEQEPHQHDDVEHVYFILSGVGIVRIGDEEQEVRDGDAIYLPPQLPHALKNVGTYPLRFLGITAKVK